MEFVRGTVVMRTGARLWAERWTVEVGWFRGFSDGRPVASIPQDQVAHWLVEEPVDQQGGVFLRPGDRLAITDAMMRAFVEHFGTPAVIQAITHERGVVILDVTVPHGAVP